MRFIGVTFKNKVSISIPNYDDPFQRSVRRLLPKEINFFRTQVGVENVQNFLGKLEQHCVRKINRILFIIVR